MSAIISPLCDFFFGFSSGGTISVAAVSGGRSSACFVPKSHPSRISSAALMSGAEKYSYGTPKVVQRVMSDARLGIALPRSHLPTLCRVTPHASAMSSWFSPSFARRAQTLFPQFLFSISVLSPCIILPRNGGNAMPCGFQKFTLRLHKFPFCRNFIQL